MDSVNEKIRILLADDHPAMRQGLRAILAQELDMVIVGEASDGVETIVQFKECRPDVTLIDLQMPKMDGLQAISAIRAIEPTALLVVLTTYPGDARVNRALSLGATSYILKTATSDEIAAALRAARSGRAVVASTIEHDRTSFRGMEDLSARELSVLRLVAQGNSNRSIGNALNVSEDTVKTRVKNILAKLGARDRTHAVTIAVKRGFLDT